MSGQRGSGKYLFTAAIAGGILCCASAFALSVITRTDITPFYSLSQVMAAKRHGGLAAEVHGGPSPAATPESILGPLRLPARVGGGHLFPVAPESAASGIRLVLLFNADYLSARAACRAPSSTGARKAADRLDVFAVLCRGGDYFSQAHLRDGSVDGEADAGYPGSMMQLLLALMPSRDEVDRDSGDDGRE